jgi:hypothetical protein
MAQTILSGAGFWAYDGTRLGELRTLAEREVQPMLGGWLAMKGGEDGSDYGVFTPELMAAWRAVGVEPVFWWYSRPRNLDLQVATVARYARAGVRAFIIDAELEWEADRQDGAWRPRDYRSVAATFAKQLRAAVGSDAVLADAPWPIPSAHALFPFDEFGAACDLRMPQAYYAVAALDRTWPRPPTAADLSLEAKAFLSRTDLEWSMREPAERVCPIVSNVDGNGSKRLGVQDLADAWDRYGARPTRSLWSLEWLNTQERAYLTSHFIEPRNDPEAPPET